MVPKGRVQASPSQSVNEWVVGEGERAQQWYQPPRVTGLLYARQGSEYRICIVS